MKSYIRNGGRGLTNLTYPYLEVGGVKNFQNPPYVIYEWLLNSDTQGEGNSDVFEITVMSRLVVDKRNIFSEMI